MPFNLGQNTEFFLVNLYFQKVKYLLKPSKEWGPAHKVPKYDLQDVEGGEKENLAQKMISNPNFNNV